MNIKLADYDVAIIGGGLAGLATAITIAKQGYKVALYEKENYPFHKVCGEYISLESAPFLSQLGINITDALLPTIHQLQITDAYGNQYPFQLPLGGFGISRYTLDEMLYTIALQHGVEVFTNTKVEDVVFANDMFEIKVKQHEHTAKVVAGCYGKRSNIDVKLKRPFIQQQPSRLQNYIGIKYHIRYAHEANVIALHNFKNGYCGLSKIEDDKSCLCYLTTAANLKAHQNSIQKMEENVLFQNPRLKKIFTEATFLYKEPLAISQISFSPKAQVENHMLMIGDAAGLITPLCGNGMSMALHGAKLATQEILLFLSGSITREMMEKNYVEQWKHNFATRLLIGRTVQRIFGGKLSTATFLQCMQQSKWLSNKLISATHGKPF